MDNFNNINCRIGKCPSCGSEESYSFYIVRQVPVHSCLLKNNFDEARNFPLGDISLGFCHSCGFIFNQAYDIEFRNYSTIYEDQQSFSPTFNSFSKKLAGQLIEKYNLHNKDIIEIGCGKGDFLVLMCELGNNRGIGIDPAFIDARIKSEADVRIEFIRDYYSEKYSHLKADMIICRHTLEHINNTSDFLRMVRASIGDDLDTVVVFELPETRRVLKESAFWDIYYEHCSYFTPGSLSRLFRSNGFKPLDLYVDFDDQYFVIECQPTDGVVDEPHLKEESVDTAKNEVDQFENTCCKKLEYWETYFETAHNKNKHVAIWGSGSKCVAFMTTIGLTKDAAMIVDINPHRHGKYLPGVGSVISTPAKLIDYKPDIIIVMNPIYLDEISADLRKMNIDAELIAV
jgi:SAM-dependent methyltransferase